MRFPARLEKWRRLTQILALVLAVVFALGPLDAYAARMYWADSSQRIIHRARLSGTNVETLAGPTGLVAPFGVAVDLVNEKLYWVDSGATGNKIYRGNLDGTGAAAIISTGLNTPLSIAVDSAGGKIYFVNQNALKIQRANLDGTSVEDLITTGLIKPYGIALDVPAGKMYFSDWGNDKIERANLDGTSREDVLVLTNPSQVLGIALDNTGGKVYWADNDRNKIQRANMADGSSIEDVATLPITATPIGVAVDADAGVVYWTDAGTRKIQRANLDGSGQVDLITTGLNSPRFIALDPRNAVPAVSDVLLAPPTPDTTVDLTASYTFEDGDGDTESGSQIRWFRDGNPEAAFDDLLTVPASATTRLEQWYFEVTPSDARDFGATIQSNTVTIANSVPTASDASLDPDPAYVDTTNLAVSYTYSDGDLDPESGTQIRWFRNDAVQNAYDDQASVDISADAPVAGDGWYATVEASDGVASAPLLTTQTVTVLNHLQVAIDGPTEIDAVAGDHVEFGVTVSGGLAANYNFQWSFTPAAKSAEPKALPNDPLLVFDPARVEDSGLYECEVSDGFEVVVTSPGVTLNVDAGVPAAGILGLLAFAAASGLGGALLVNRREKKS